MSSDSKVIRISREHIKPGIEKYGGQLDEEIHNIIKGVGLSFTPYSFRDGRILLVLPNAISALLYPDRESLFQLLKLE